MAYEMSTQKWNYIHLIPNCFLHIHLGTYGKSLQTESCRFLPYKKYILKNYLTDEEYEVRIAADGVEGISKFDENISLVLLDVMLPKIDGFGVCEVIRSKSQVPIIMLTALADEKNQVRGFKQKIDDYVPKPFSPQILWYKISVILRRRMTKK